MQLARRWSTVMAIQFAIGVVTGTVISLEFGLLWPGLMGRWGDVFGIGFGIEAWAFFLEAILIAIYLYGWKRLSPGPISCSGCRSRSIALLGAFGDPVGERVDEHAAGLHPRRGRATRPRSRRARCCSPDVRAAVLALHRRRLHDGGLPGRQRLRRRLAARAPGPLPPPRLPRPVHRRRDRHAGPVRDRRRPRPLGLPGAAGEVRGHRDRLDDRRRTSPSTSTAGCSRTAPSTAASRSPGSTRSWPGSAGAPWCRGSAAVPADDRPTARRGDDRALGVRHHGRDRDRCCCCSRSGTGWPGCGGATCPGRGGSTAAPPWPGSRPWSRSRPAGSPPRSAGSRGSSGST